MLSAISAMVSTIRRNTDTLTDIDYPRSMRSLQLPIVIVAAIAAGCASAGGPAPAPFPTPGGRPVAPAGGTTSTTSTVPGETLVNTALGFQGTPYRFGGTNPTGFDCSGLVRYVFAQHGIAMPRLAAQQFEVGRKVELDDVQPGDLVFFSTIAPGPSHVGIAVGGGEFVHAPSSLGWVQTERLDSSYWRQRFIAATRVE